MLGSSELLLPFPNFYTFCSLFPTRSHFFRYVDSVGCTVPYASAISVFAVSLIFFSLPPVLLIIFPFSTRITQQETMQLTLYMTQCCFFLKSVNKLTSFSTSSTHWRSWCKNTFHSHYSLLLHELVHSKMALSMNLERLQRHINYPK